MNRREFFIEGFFEPRFHPDGTAEVVPAYDKLVRMGQGNPGGSLHPIYNIDIENDEFFQHLTEFYQLTNALLRDDQCPGTGFPP